MKYSVPKPLWLAVALLLSSFAVDGRQALAESVVACHCFQVREFSPADPAAFDPYLLATIQNRLLAAYAGVERKEVVRAKMSGQPGEVLWVAHAIAGASGRSVDDVIERRVRSGSWLAVIRELETDPESLGGAFWAALSSPGRDVDAARIVISGILRDSFQVPDDSLKLLWQRGAGLQEGILACLLGRRLGREPHAVLADAVSAGAWGLLMERAGESIGSLDALIASIFPPSAIP